MRPAIDLNEMRTASHGSDEVLAISSFRWLVRQVAWALALEQLRDVGVTPPR
jgi:hypothetical protein